jgi:DNA-binding NtrC family response regulator
MSSSSELLGREYLRLFSAMEGVLDSLFDNADKETVLRQSFEAAADGFGAEKALLLVVTAQGSLRNIYAKGLTDVQIGACEAGASVPGVSSTLIKAALESAETILVKDPRHHEDARQTSALAGMKASVLVSPIVEPVSRKPVAVMYFQNHGLIQAFTEVDESWVRGYSKALGRAFALQFERHRLLRERDEVLVRVANVDRVRRAPDLIGDSAATLTLRRELHELWIPAATRRGGPDPLLILGETGTGKELIARYIHAYSSRREKPFITVDCTTLDRNLAASTLFGHERGAFTGADTARTGSFRDANGGVLLIDEIGDLVPEVQGQLLRALDNRTVQPLGSSREIPTDVFVILATNKDLAQLVSEGKFKADLYQRFRVQNVRLVPLRDRASDIRPLLRHFVGHYESLSQKRTLGLADDAVRALIAYSWPGNIRELARMCSALVLRAAEGTWIDVETIRRVDPGVLDPAHRNTQATGVDMGSFTHKQAMRSYERELILATLERHRGSRRAAREALGLTHSTFHRMLYAHKVIQDRSTDGADW